ncbi:hypothetical protein L1887_55567 [Cichorium endivia]|nr:hypothetical protein L1887_55567 [Cichorium endivia]
MQPKQTPQVRARRARQPDFTSHFLCVSAIGTHFTDKSPIWQRRVVCLQRAARLARRPVAAAPTSMIEPPDSPGLPTPTKTSPKSKRMSLLPPIHADQLRGIQRALYCGTGEPRPGEVTDGSALAMQMWRLFVRRIEGLLPPPAFQALTGLVTSTRVPGFKPARESTLRPITRPDSVDAEQPNPRDQRARETALSARRRMPLGVQLPTPASNGHLRPRPLRQATRPHGFSPFDECEDLASSGTQP